MGSVKSKGYKVLAIDLDQQANLTRYMSANPKLGGIFSVLKGISNIKDEIQHTAEFDVIPGNDSLSKSDTEFTDIRTAQSRLRYGFIAVRADGAKEMQPLFGTAFFMVISRYQ